MWEERDGKLKALCLMVSAPRPPGPVVLYHCRFRGPSVQRRSLELPEPVMDSFLFYIDWWNDLKKKNQVINKCKAATCIVRGVASSSDAKKTSPPLRLYSLLDSFSLLVLKPATFYYSDSLSLLSSTSFPAALKNNFTPLHAPKQQTNTFAD